MSFFNRQINARQFYLLIIWYFFIPFFLLLLSAKLAIARDYINLVNQSVNRCLNIHAGRDDRNGGSVTLYSCADSPDQQWEILDLEGAWFQLKNRSTSRCLNIHRGNANFEGGPITSYDCADTPDQQWRFLNPAGGYIQLQNRGTNRCLNVHRGRHDFEGAPSTSYSCSTSPDQKWQRKEPAASVSTLTPDDFGQGRMKFEGQSGSVTLNVLILMTNYADTSFDPDQTARYYRDRLVGTGTGGTVRGFIGSNGSGLEVDLNVIDVVRTSDPRALACAHRWSGRQFRGLSEGTCRTHAIDDNPFTMATVENIERLPASQVASLARYDRDGDGKLTNDELFVIEVGAARPPAQGYPYGENGGLTRWLPRCASLRDTSKEICGRFLPVGDKVNLATITHEIFHLFGAVDLYGGSYSNNASYTTMASTISSRELFFSLDPWHKMQMGFVAPTVVSIQEGRDGRKLRRLSPPVFTASYKPVLFYDSSRGRNEFFIVEYRKRDTNVYDRGVASTGLVIWYVNTSSSGSNPVNLIDVDASFPEGNAVAVIGAPDQRIATGRAWTQAHGEIALNWPSGGDSGLRLKVVSEASETGVTIEWWSE